MNLRRKRRAPPTDVVIELNNADELLAADPRGLLAGAHRIDSGMDELVERLLTQRKIAADQRVVLDIASECSDEQAARMVSAVRRYCELRLRRANREHDLIWRQGMRSLLSGSLLFVVGIALSYLFTRPVMGEFANDLLGNGVFLVVAWVGLWYPLDLLFIAGNRQSERSACSARCSPCRSLFAATTAHCPLRCYPVHRQARVYRQASVPDSVVFVGHPNRAFRTFTASGA